MTDAATGIVSSVASGVGYAVVGPLAGGALDAPAVRDALRARGLELALWLGLGVAGGVALGMVVGRMLGGSR